jgi:hypothetical protein
MLRRTLWLARALVLAAAAAGFALAGSAGAQEEPDRPPPCNGDVCTMPAPCDPNVLCLDPIDCPDEVLCTPPYPCDERGCEIPDADGDGHFDFDEEYWGSDPNDANSTPEHAFVYGSCVDGVDNDRDGSTDAADRDCDIDSDGDGWDDPIDNCPWDSNALQADRDGDGTGDACDFDADNDFWDDETERLSGSDPNDANSTPEATAIGYCDDGIDNDRDGMTDAADPGCAPDEDYDFIPNSSDNCPTMWNSDQADRDGDGTGDACEDADGDGVFDLDEEALGSDPDDPSSTPEYPWFGENNACEDGRDNDGDGLIDGNDEGCLIMFDELPAAAESLTGRDTAAGGDKDVVPISLPAAGTGASGSSNLTLLIALASAAAVAGSGLTVAGLRAARKTTSR